jgi:hypothetical protein
VLYQPSIRAIKEIRTILIINFNILFRYIGQIKICGCTNEERCQVNEEPCEEGQKGKEREKISLNLKSSSVFILTQIQSQMLIIYFAEVTEQFLFFVYIYTALRIVSEWSCSDNCIDAGTSHSSQYFSSHLLCHTI